MNDYEALKIGALLHDIGKWYKIVKNDEEDSHIEYGCKFVEDCYNKNKILPVNLDNDDITAIKKLVSNHHSDDAINKDNYLLEILKISDALSNGELIPYKKGDTDYFKELPSIFENIDISDKEKNNEKKYKDYNECKKYKISPLKINNETIFPVDDKYIKDYPNNIDISDESFERNFENLLLFIQKYTWCVPSTFSREYGNKKYVPDVSLYDHLKTTCAIACCLYKNKNIDEEYIENLLNNLENESSKIKEIRDKYNEKIDNTKDDDKKKIIVQEKIKEIKELLKNDIKYSNKNIFSLIHGDISGVQDFIFNITSKGANKSLKGRSFYLDFLTELCAKYVVQKLELSLANILFYGGGHFYILSYKVNEEKTEEFKEKSNNSKSFNIEDFEKEINDILFKKFGADLYVAIGKVDLRPIDFLMDCMDENTKIGIPYKWKECAEATSKRKMRKFGYKGMDLFEAEGSGDENKRCQVCKNESDKLYTLDDNTKICKNCASFMGITKFLKEFGEEGIVNYESKHYIKVFEKNMKFYEIPTLKEFYESIDFDNKYYNLPDKEGNLKIPYKIWSIAFPLDKDGKIMEFLKLAEQAEERTGTNKIAILKMDVDDLGKIITKGLRERATLSRLSTLSSMLTLFFTGYIPYLIKTGEAETESKNGKKAKVKYRDNIYLTYSGGDDTLIVGAWDTVWDLTKEINDKFKKFVCYNPDITLSAGVVLVSPKFEYRKGVYLAEDELENAKENKIRIDGEEKEKNSISIFGHALVWDKIKDERDLENKFIKAINNTNKKRIVHLTQKVYLNLEKALIKNKNSNNNEFRLNIPYLWRMKYYLYRNYNKDGEEWDYVGFLEEYLNNIEDSIKSGEGEFDFNDILIASRIAELKSRKEENNELDE